MTPDAPIPYGFPLRWRGCRVGQWTHNKSDPARCVNTECAGPRRTDKEFD